MMMDDCYENYCTLLRFVLTSSNNELTVKYTLFETSFVLRVLEAAWGGRDHWQLNDPTTTQIISKLYNFQYKIAPFTTY